MVTMSQELSLTQIPQAVPWALTPDILAREKDLYPHFEIVRVDLIKTIANKIALLNQIDRRNISQTKVIDAPLTGFVGKISNDPPIG